MGILTFQIDKVSDSSLFLRELVFYNETSSCQVSSNRSIIIFEIIGIKTNRHTGTQTDTHSNKFTHTRARTHKYTRARTHPRTQTHTHTHTHNHVDENENIPV